MGIKLIPVKNCTITCNNIEESSNNIGIDAIGGDA